MSTQMFNMAIRGRGTRRGRGRGHFDPPRPSQLQTSPPQPTLLPLGDIGGTSDFGLPAGDNLATSVPPAGGPTKCPLGRGSSRAKVVSNPNLATSVPPASSSSSLPTSEGSRVENDRRTVIFVEAISKPRRFVPQTVTHDIVSTVIMRMPTPAERWKDYPGDMKDELFKDFMGKYQFASDFDRNMARTVWERTCMDRYPDHLKNARVAALKQAELKHPVSFRDVFDRVHKKKDGEYVSKHSKNFIESYDTTMLKKYGEALRHWSLPHCSSNTRRRQGSCKCSNVFLCSNTFGSYVGAYSIKDG
ncbi:putative transposase, Ptta/En/Spm, plant [Sesbania bispinosa]|nr:putative transposase, Ptta/En/Spm, plant [Sesbania bispinosa]